MSVRQQSHGRRQQRSPFVPPELPPPNSARPPSWLLPPPPPGCPPPPPPAPGPLPRDWEDAVSLPSTAERFPLQEEWIAQVLARRFAALPGHPFGPGAAPHAASTPAWPGQWGAATGEQDEAGEQFQRDYGEEEWDEGDGGGAWLPEGGVLLWTADGGDQTEGMDDGDCEEGDSDPAFELAPEWIERFALTEMRRRQRKEQQKKADGQRVPREVARGADGRALRVTELLAASRGRGGNATGAPTGNEAEELYGREGAAEILSLEAALDSHFDDVQLQLKPNAWPCEPLR